MEQLIIPIAAGAATWLILLWLLNRPAGSIVPLDYPNERSLHVRPIPRIGGVAICATSLPVIALTWSPIVAGVAGMLALLSYFDDRHDLPVAVRFLAHVASGVILVLAVNDAVPFPIMVLGAVAAAWMINLYNFMDGSDGLAGGMAAIGFGAYAVAAALHDGPSLTLSSATLAVCAIAFLHFNLHPAKTFMGDVGSVPLGFFAAAIGFTGWHTEMWPWWFPLLVFSPFIVDATVTLLRRILNGERFWAAHRSHYYQRLVQMGWGHRKTANAEFALMIFCAAVALGLLRQPPHVQFAVLGVVAALYVVLALAVDRSWKNYVSLRQAP